MGRPSTPQDVEAQSDAQIAMGQPATAAEAVGSGSDERSTGGTGDRRNGDGQAVEAIPWLSTSFCPACCGCPQRGSSVFVDVRGQAERANVVGRSCLCSSQALGSLPVSIASCRPFA